MKKETRNPRLDPSDELCSIYDETGTRLFPLPKPEEMGMIVTDNFHEEHIQ